MFQSLDTYTLNFYPPTLELCHIFTDNLKPIPMHHVRDPLFQPKKKHYEEYVAMEARICTSSLEIERFAVASLKKVILQVDTSNDEWWIQWRQWIL